MADVGCRGMKLVLFALSFAGLSLAATGVSAQSAPTAAAAPVSRVHQLEMEDQSENPGNISAAEFYRHGDARRAEVRKLLAEGKLTSGEDFSDAALLFQHGQTADDFLFAHILAVEGLIRGTKADKWIAAATLDRYLQAVNHPQVFGTQYPGESSATNTPKPQLDPHAAAVRCDIPAGLCTSGLLRAGCESAAEECRDLQHWT